MIGHAQEVWQHTARWTHIPPRHPRLCIPISRVENARGVPGGWTRITRRCLPRPLRTGRRQGSRPRPRGGRGRDGGGRHRYGRRRRLIGRRRANRVPPGVPGPGAPLQASPRLRGSRRRHPRRGSRGVCRLDPRDPERGVDRGRLGPARGETRAQRCVRGATPVLPAPGPRQTAAMSGVSSPAGASSSRVCRGRFETRGGRPLERCEADGSVQHCSCRAKPMAFSPTRVRRSFLPSVAPRRPACSSPRVPGRRADPVVVGGSEPGGGQTRIVCWSRGGGGGSHL